MLITASVAVDVKHPQAKKEYTYFVPESMADSICIGDLVVVPFNKIKVYGVVTEVFRGFNEEAGHKLKEIFSREGITLHKELINLSVSLAEYYGTAVIDFLKLMLPPKVSFKRQLVYSVIDPEYKVSGRAPNQKRIFEFIKNKSNVTVAEIAESLKINPASIRSALGALKKKGIIKKDYKIVRRNPVILENQENSQNITLTHEQRKALIEINRNLNGEKKPTLIYGVTGSGKTEVYIRAVENVLNRGKSALILVPEISLTPQLLAIFHSRFKGKTAVLHSRLSQGERFDEWQRIYSGQARVILGARSAVFAPAKDLGIIIIDEEHEASYKNGEHPYYDARVVAKYRAELNKALLILGSATPSVESFYRAAKGEYSIIKLTKRVFGKRLPKIEIVNMKKELESGNRHIFSKKLLSYTKLALENNKQVILFLNRRGHSTFILCRDCGFVLKCKFCDISLTYHLKNKKAICHYCGYSVEAPDICPVCKSSNIRYFGTGTEKVEQEIKKIFPNYKTLRIDSDTTSQKGSMEKLLWEFKHGKAHILIGTQSIAKGLDFPNVTVVGIINADTALNMPDFRAGERTFQLITQVAGRAGRGDTPGIVCVQTYTPESFAIKAACNFDISGFYKEELKIRYKALYPPFCHMLNIKLKSSDELSVVKEAERISRIISENIGSADINIYGPLPAPRPRIKDNYRYNILVKGKQIQTLTSICNILQDIVKSSKVDVAWDMDPQDLL